MNSSQNDFLDFLGLSTQPQWREHLIGRHKRGRLRQWGTQVKNACAIGEHLIGKHKPGRLRQWEGLALLRGWDPEGYKLPSEDRS